VGTRFSARPDQSWGPPFCKMGAGSFPGVKCGQGMLLTTHPLLVPWSWNSRAIPLPILWATPGVYGITLLLPFIEVGLLAVLAKGCYSSAQYMQVNSEKVPGNK